MKNSNQKKAISIPSKSKTITFDKFMNENYGKVGTKKRALNNEKLEKVEAKLVKEHTISKNKIVKPSIDEIAFDKDLRKVLKKHNINIGCFIASIPKGKNKVKRIISTFNPNQEEENLLLDSMMNLLTKINLTSGDINAISYLIDQNKK